MKSAIYPGSFDPVTNGHLDVIRRATKIFGKVIVAVATNSEKSPLFTVAERIHLISAATADIPGVEVTGFDGLLVTFARQAGVAAILRGLRAVTDFENEFQMALINRKLQPSIETVFLAAREEFTYVSSRIIKEVARLNGDISQLVPPHVATALREKLA